MSATPLSHAVTTHSQRAHSVCQHTQRTAFIPCTMPRRGARRPDAEPGASKRRASMRVMHPRNGFHLVERDRHDCASTPSLAADRTRDEWQAATPRQGRATPSRCTGTEAGRCACHRFAAMARCGSRRRARRAHAVRGLRVSPDTGHGSPPPPLLPSSRRAVDAVAHAVPMPRPAVDSHLGEAMRPARSGHE